MTTDSEFLDDLSVETRSRSLAWPQTTTTSSTATKRRPVQPSWVPFPTDIFPEPLRSYVKGGARAMRCDEAYIALPMV
ncbi:MAG: hypothetical protein HQ582_20850, partial [Planctomycetes bacterium]|nr:hypothetical protein [Planctomycetota bacterium]